MFFLDNFSLTHFSKNHFLKNVWSRWQDCCYLCLVLKLHKHVKTSLLLLIFRILNLSIKMGILGIKPITPKSSSYSPKIHIKIILPNKDLKIRLLTLCIRNRDRTIAGNTRLYSIWIPLLRSKAVLSLKRTTGDTTETNCRNAKIMMKK